MISVSYREETIVHAGHNVGEANYHFQFTPKYRRKVFKDETIKRACKSAFMEIARRWGIKLLAVEFGPDHCHIFIANCRKYSVSQLAQYFKGAISRVLRNNHMERLKHARLGRSFWTDGYFYESVGRVTSDSIKFYIERQHGTHWDGEDYEMHQTWKGQSRLDNWN
jgi:REP element-mobilizing transposase RayT